MNWINIETKTLRSPEFIGSEPEQRATWLCLLAYCAEQENGGKIAACGEWKARRWQQTCGVTTDEVCSHCDLWTWEADSLTVWGYPVEKENEVRMKREGGQRGGKARAKNAVDKGIPEDASSIASSTPSSSASTEEKRRERNRIEKKEIELGDESPFALSGTSSCSVPTKKVGITYDDEAGFSGISEADRLGWKRAYPAVNIDRSIAAAGEWLKRNPAKRKKAVGRYLSAWLAREQERGGDIPANRQPARRFAGMIENLELP
jgi:hypothetical protein